MAFLVCYSSSPPADQACNKAVYLDQRFYELIFTHCRSEDAPYSVLRDVASLRYKSPSLVLARDRLELLDEELLRFEASGISHPQISELRSACARAQSLGLSLAISGDMHSEL